MVSKGGLQTVLLIFLMVAAITSLCSGRASSQPTLSGLYSQGQISGITKSVAANALPQINTRIHVDGFVEGVSAFEYSQDEESGSLVVRQANSSAVINWDTFDIGSQAQVRFDQQGHSSWSALNRIWDAGPSAIFGSLQADGTIFVINQNGVLFGPDSRVNVFNLVATSLDMDDESFRAGGWKTDSFGLTAANYRNDPDWDALAAEIRNEGYLQAEGGIFLAAPAVENTGTTSPMVLATGTEVDLHHIHQFQLPHLDRIAHADGVVEGIRSIVYSGDRGGETLDIFQEEDAVVQWSDFHIGENAGVFYHQDDSTLSALNRVMDDRPSLLFGELSADGRLVLINQNGMRFGPEAEVGIHTLVASSLNVDDEEFLSGNWKENTLRLGLGSAGTQYAEDNYQGLIYGDGPGQWNEEAAQIVNQGTINADVSGAVFLVGPEVVNSGEINAPVGQAGLVAAAKAQLTFQESLARKVVVPVAAGAATNTAEGRIVSDLGTAGMYGRIVNQDGLIRAVTAIQKNGDIELLATEGVRTGAGSQTICPITDSGERLNPQTEILPSSIRVQGLLTSTAQSAAPPPRTIEHKGTLSAPSGVVSLLAEEAVSLAAGSSIDVSGLWANRSASANQLAVQLNSVELADAFEVREGGLRGETVYINALLGSDIGHLTGHFDTEDLTAGERFTFGGQVLIEARSGTVDIERGARIDFAGGGYHYAPGAVNSSLVLFEDRIYEIYDLPDSALENGASLSLVSEEEANRLGRTMTRRIDAYDEGHDAGRLTVVADRVRLEGEMDGSATAGVHQTLAAEPSETIGEIAYPLVRGRREPLSGGLYLGEPLSFGEDGFEYELGPVFLHGGSMTGAGDGSDTASFIDTRLLNRAGLGSLVIHSNDGVVLAEDAAVRLAPSFQTSLFQVLARSISVYGDIRAPGGRVDFQSMFTKSVFRGPADTPDRIYLAPGALIDVSGERLDFSLLGADAVSSPFRIGHLNGGSVSFKDNIDEGAPLESVFLAPGSAIDVSGGYAVGRSGRSISGGDAGSISLEGPAVIVDGSLSAHSIVGNTGGHLTLHADRVRIDSGRPAVVSPIGSGWILPGDRENLLVLGADQFDGSGFSDISVSSVGELEIAAGLYLDASRIKYAVVPSDSFSRITGPTVLYQAVEDGLLEPSAIRFSANKNRSANESVGFSETLFIPESTTIAAAPGGLVVLAAPRVAVGGALSAPGGTIQLTAESADLQTGEGIEYALTLLSGARISVRGFNRPLYDRTNPGLPMRYHPEDGGQVNLTAKTGTIRAEAGSSIDVSGASAVRNQFPGPLGVVESQIAAGAPGGAVFIGKEIEIDSLTMTAAKGQAFLPGGSLTLLKVDSAEALSITDAALERYKAAGFDAVSFQSVYGVSFTGDIEADFSRSLTLDAPRFLGSDDQTVHLSAPYIRLENGIDKFDESTVQNPVMQLVSLEDLSEGEASDLLLSARWLDIEGVVGMSGFENIILSAEKDIRLADSPLIFDGNAQIYKDYRGELNTLADLHLTAARIYPTSETEFSISTGYLNADDWTGGNVTINQAPGAAGSDPIYSAGGSLTIRSHRIAHFGTLAAPFGSILLDAVGGRIGGVADPSRIYLGQGSSLVTAAGKDQMIVYGRYGEDLTWTLQDKSVSAGTLGNPVEEAPTGAIGLFADEVVFRDGAAVDFSGGGHVYAARFFPSIQGSVDPLALPNRHVILPDGSVQLPGKGIHLQGGAGIAGGTYSILDASYAFVPGALILEDLGPATPDNPMVQSMAGDPLVIGSEAAMGTGLRSDELHYYAVLTPAEVLKEGLFKGEAMQVGEGGSFTAIGATTIINGSIAGDGEAGFAGGEVQLSGTQINVGSGSSRLPADFTPETAFTGDLTAFRNRLTVNPETLSGSGLDRIELGNINGENEALTRHAASGFQLLGSDPDIDGGLGSASLSVASSIEFEADVQLAVNSLGLYAENEVRLNAGVQLAAEEILIQTEAAGKTIIGGGGNIAADRLGIFSGGIDLQTGSGAHAGPTTLAISDTLALGSFQSVALVDAASEPFVDAGANFFLTEDLWGGFGAIETVSLITASGITVYGDVDISTGKTLNLFTPRIGTVFGLDGSGQPQGDNAVAHFNANDINLMGIDPESPLLPVSNNGVASVFELAADNILLVGGGAVGFSGVERIYLTAGIEDPDDADDVRYSGDLVFGRGTMDTGGGDLGLTAARITSVYEFDVDGRYVTGDYAIDAGDGRVDIFRGQGTGGGWHVPGGSLAIDAGTIVHAGTIDLHAGTVSLSAADSLELQAGSEILARGGAVQAYDHYRQSFFETPVGPLVDVNRGGRVELAGGGAFFMAGAAEGLPAALVDVSNSIGADLVDAADEDHRRNWRDAGRLDAGGVAIRALQEDASVSGFNGRLDGYSDFGGAGGAVSLDSKAFDLTQVAGMIANFDDVRLRAREGDLILETTLAAHRIRIAADGGRISVGNGVFDAQGDLEGVTGAGNLIAGGENGAGRIELFARDDVLLLEGSGISAAAADDAVADGGEVMLGSRQGWIRIMDLADTDTSASIDVSAAAGGRGGTVHFRAQRMVRGDQSAAAADPAADDVRMALNGTVTGASSVVVEAVRPYDGWTEETTLSSQTDAYMTAVEAADASGRLRSELSLGESVSLHYRPGIEIRASDSLIISDSLDLSSDLGRYGPNGQETGILTLRVNNDLTVNADISDGSQSDIDMIFAPIENDTWDIRLVAGADLDGADPLAIDTDGVGNLAVTDGWQVYTESGELHFAAAGDVTLTGGSIDHVFTGGGETDAMHFSIGTFDGDIAGDVGGNLTIRDGSAVQSATGRIELSIGGDLTMSDAAAAVRTTGKPVEPVWDELRNDEKNAGFFGARKTWKDEWPTSWEGGWDEMVAAGDPNFLSQFNGLVVTSAKGYYWHYARGGGVDVTVGGSIRGSASIPEEDDYWMQQYQFKSAIVDEPAYYGASFRGKPTGGIAAMAGGNVGVSAGNDIVRPRIGTFGKGDLSIRSGGNLDGRFYVSNGSGRLSAMGSFGADDIYDGALALEMDQAQVSLDVQGSITMGSIVNPTYADPDFEDFCYLTYGEDSAAALRTFHGDVVLAGESFFHDGADPNQVGLLPPGIDIVSAGSIRFDSSLLVLAPSPVGNLNLTAGRDISVDRSISGSNWLVMSDMAPELVYAHYPRPDGYTQPGETAQGQVLNKIGSASFHGYTTAYENLFLSMWNDPDFADQDRYQEIYNRLSGRFVLHGEDSRTSTISAGSDIVGLKLGMAEAVQINAGTNIEALYLLGQNINGADITGVMAGGRIDLNALPGKTGAITGIQMGGPGLVLVQAGLSLELGKSLGIDTIGSEYNPALGRTGSSVIVISGYAADLVTDAESLPTPEKVGLFFDELLEAGVTYSALNRGQRFENGEIVDVSIDWARRLGPEYAAMLTGYSDYGSVPDEVRDVLAQMAVDHARQEIIDARLILSEFDAADTDRAAVPDIGIEFERPVPFGGLNMEQSLVRTKSGGDIQILAAGDFNVGQSAFGTTSDDSGINLQYTGDVDIFTVGDINVNESRVMTWYGGDIFMWSDEGNINAGKGSKTTVSLSTRINVYDEALALWIPKSSPPAVGSGIRLLTYDPDGVFGPQVAAAPGDGYLFAPSGEIDAGEAGIKGLGTLIFEAERILNTENIEIAGLSIGVPAQTEGAAGISGLSGVGSLSDTTSGTQANEAMNAARDRYASQSMDLASALVPRWLSVEVVGFENGDGDEEKD